MNTRKQHKTIV